jgi:hypothetical protein
MPNKHPKVPPTKANCEKDFQAKLKLNAQFKEFKKQVDKAAKSSPAVEKLKIPLKKLEDKIIIAAHGRHFVVND